jgi:hypothetical protein
MDVSEMDFVLTACHVETVIFLRKRVSTPSQFVIEGGALA